MRKNEGFTLIELLVVIAIIALLASIVLVAVGSARAKGIDAAAKQNLSNAVPQAELYNSNNGTYSGICQASTVGGIRAMLDSAAKVEKITNYGSAMANGECHDSPTAWAASIPLKNGVNQFFCVDSSGASNQTSWPSVYGGATKCNISAPPGT